MHAHERRDPNHPLRRVRDYRPDGTRTRRWSGPERSMRLSYRRRPLMTVAATLLAVVMPATIVVAASSIGSSPFRSESDDIEIAVNDSGRVIAIGGAGFGLSAVTVAVGESVSFINTDTVPHEVVTEPATGSSCDSAGLVVWPGVYRSCTFDGTGTYTVRDIGSASPSFRTEITVAQQADVLSSIALSVDRTRIVSGRSVILRGSINIAQAGAQVDIVAKNLADGKYRKVGQTRTDASGAYSFVARPTRTTAYFANAILNMTVVTSPSQTVEVSSK